MEHASDEFKADKEVVLVAVAQNGNALEHASDELKADKEVVLAAVTQRGNALSYASDELKGDKEVQALHRAKPRRRSIWMKPMDD